MKCYTGFWIWVDTLTPLGNGKMGMTFGT